MGAGATEPGQQVLNRGKVAGRVGKLARHFGISLLVGTGSKPVNDPAQLLMNPRPQLGGALGLVIALQGYV